MKEPNFNTILPINPNSILWCRQVPQEIRWSIACFLIVAIMTGLLGCGSDSDLDLTNSFTVSESTILEGNSIHTKAIIVKASKPVHPDFEVTYTLAEDHAKFNDDFIAASGVLDFSQNTTEAILNITIVGDTHPELNEALKLIITYHGTTYEIPLLIEDDDPIQASQILTDEDGYYTPAEYASMQMVWSDEFNGSTLQAADWTHEIGTGCPNLCGWGNNELQSYTNSPDNVSVANGMLTITARESAGSYTSARIKTQDKQDFTFGRIDVRARLPKGQGIWPAIWMLGSNIPFVSWPACGEIDIMELVGHQPAFVHGTVHYLDGVYKYSTGTTSLTSGDFSDQFHVFTIMWDVNKIQWYVDNQLFKTFTNAGVFNYPFNNKFFFILNVAVGGNWPGSPDGTTVFPQSMTVDYIRVFR